MEEKIFKEFLRAVRGDEDDERVWKKRYAEIETIIRELMGKEFTQIPTDKKIIVRITNNKTNLGERTAAGIGTLHFPRGGDYTVLFIRASNWKRPGFSRESLRQVLRHELLHIETGMKDNNPAFQSIARTSNIPLKFQGDYHGMFTV